MLNRVFLNLPFLFQTCKSRQWSSEHLCYDAGNHDRAVKLDRKISVGHSVSVICCIQRIHRRRLTVVMKFFIASCFILIISSRYNADRWCWCECDRNGCMAFNESLIILRQITSVLWRAWRNSKLSFFSLYGNWCSRQCDCCRNLIVELVALKWFVAP
jgi:hypothetical protein